VWEALKLEVFIPGEVSPRVILSDCAGGLIKSVPLAFPDVYFQSCDWHAAKAMLKWYRHKELRLHHCGIEGVRARAKVTAAPDVQTHEYVKVVSGLYDLSWSYIQPMSLEALSVNRKALRQKMRPHDRWYLESEWTPKEKQFIWYYAKSYLNLGSTTSWRGESHHPVVREITNSQLSFEELGKRLSRKVLSILKDLATDDSSLRGYDRLVQLDFAAFKYLATTISNKALEMIEKEWYKLKTTLLTDQGADLGIRTYDFFFPHKLFSVSQHRCFTQALRTSCSASVRPCPVTFQLLYP
jgi:hypothetical protein